MQLPVLTLRAEFSTTEQRLRGGIGLGVVHVSSGALGTLRLQFGARQAFVLINLADPEVVDALTASRKAGFVPVYMSIGGTQSVVIIRINPDFGLEAIKRGLARPMTAEAFVGEVPKIVGTNYLVERATSDIPEIPTLEHVTVDVLVTCNAERASDAAQKIALAQIADKAGPLH